VYGCYTFQQSNGNTTDARSTLDVVSVKLLNGFPQGVNVRWEQNFEQMLTRYHDPIPPHRQRYQRPS
jgi:hypothetical protein